MKPGSAIRAKERDVRRVENDLSIRDRIVLIAEKHFANFGYYGATIRNITKDAFVDLSMVNYYFGGKDGLFTAVIELRTCIINNEIMGRLNALPQDATVHAIVEAYIGATIEKLASGDSGWRDHFRLTTNAAGLTEKRDLLSPMITAHAPVRQRCLDLLSCALPAAVPADLVALTQMMATSVAQVANESKMAANADPAIELPDYLEYGRLMVQMFTSGFLSLPRERINRVELSTSG